jgi:hypothetical protein
MKFYQAKNPKLDKLKKLQQKATSVRKKIATITNSGIEHAAVVDRARDLVLELAGLTWDSLALQMELAGELLPTWTKPEYYHDADLGAWAKVHALSTGQFVLEAVTEDGAGGLTVVRTYQMLAAWQPCTAEQYRAALDRHLAEPGGIQWNAWDQAEAQPYRPE